MMQDRLEEEKKNDENGITHSDPIVKREISAIYTKGTFQKDKTDSSYMTNSQNVLLYLYEKEKKEFGFTFFDITTLKFHTGYFQDDEMLTKFRTLISRVRPVEVL